MMTLRKCINISYRASGPNADIEKVRLYCDRTLEHYDWLTRQGVVFKPEYYPKKHTNTPNEAALMITGNEDAWPDNTHAKPAPRGHKPQIKGDHGGIPLMKNLLRSAREKGVEIICDARALNVIKDGGMVVGVAARIDMQERYFQGSRRCCSYVGRLHHEPGNGGRLRASARKGKLPQWQPQRYRRRYPHGLGCGWRWRQYG